MREVCLLEQNVQFRIYFLSQFILLSLFAIPGFPEGGLEVL